MSVYSRWVERDLDRWRAAGWISDDGAEAIRRDLAERRGGFGLREVFALIGAILLIFAFSAFVAANWQAIPRPGKLALFLGLTWAAYGAAYALKKRRPAFSEAAALTGVGLFGADIMLIGQMYHLSGAPHDAVLLWALGGLLAGVLLRSAPILTLTAGLFILWAEWAAIGGDLVQGGRLLALLALAAGFAVATRWRGAFHIIAISLLWLAFTLGFRDNLFAASFLTPAALGLIAMTVGLAADRRPALDAALDHRARALTIYGFLLAAAALFFFQVSDLEDVRGLLEFGPYAALATAFVLGALWIGVLRGHDALIWWAIAALALQLCMLYLRTLGTLLETALFFLIAAGLTILLAMLTARRSRRDEPGEGAS